MPICEFACPKCGNKDMDMVKQMSPFAAPRGAKEPVAKPEGHGAEPPMPDMDDPRIMRAMSEMERDIEQVQVDKWSTNPFSL
jgi:hypothetical protein